MKKTLLFAIDRSTTETIVSESAKGSAQIQLIERIPQHSLPLLYHAVDLLTQLSQATPFNASAFKAMDKVCQSLYTSFKQKEND